MRLRNKMRGREGYAILGPEGIEGVWDRVPNLRAAEKIVEKELGKGYSVVGVIGRAKKDCEEEAIRNSALLHGEISGFFRGDV